MIGVMKEKESKPAWTQFMDMHSGGGLKIEPYSHIYIEAPVMLAKSIFKERFNRDPDNVTRRCCGEDYSVTESPDLAQATGYERGCAYEDHAYVERSKGGRYASGKGPQTVEEYSARPDVLIIRREVQS